MDCSSGKAEELVDKTDFACRTGLRQDAVTTSDHAHDLKALQCHGCGFHSPEAAGWPDYALKRAVIRLDDVIEVL